MMRRQSTTVSFIIGLILISAIVTLTFHNYHLNEMLQQQIKSKANDEFLFEDYNTGGKIQVVGASALKGIYDHDFSWTIFITPQGFVGLPKVLQTRAIESWLRLDPKPKIVLVGQGEGYEEVAEQYGLEINPGLDLNLVLMPLAGSLMDVAMKADTEISVILNSDILLTQSFADALAKVRTQFTDWFLSGARYDIAELPPSFEPSRPDFDEEAFTAYVRHKGILHTAGGQDYFAWNNNGKPLYHGIMPPFIRGKSKFDNWIAHEVVEGRYRDAIDGTGSVIAVHVLHDYVSAEGKTSKGKSEKQTFWMKSKSSDWQILHNVNLAISFGSYRNQDGTTVRSPYKLSPCLEPGGMCLIKRIRPGVCPCEHNTFAVNTQSDPQLRTITGSSGSSTIIQCGTISTDQAYKYVIPTATLPGAKPTFGLPFTMEDILPLVARNNHVIVTGVSYIYRDVVMNFVCNLRRLGIYDSLVLAAFDEEMYKFGFQMGLPIFLYKNDKFAHMNSFELEYGSNAFKKVTKLKSRVVLDILKLGYDVTWTDTDITWFKNPMPELEKMDSDFVVQSNAPYPEEKDANGPLRINSGFYRIRSKPATLDAFEKIVAHAEKSSLTEQPSFYMILCGGTEGTTVVGSDKCHYKYKSGLLGKMETVVVQFLDRNLYPNGSCGFWESDDIAKDHPQLVILHNNWIKGLRAKIERTVTKNLWFYDREKMICNYDPKPQYEFNWSVDVDA